MKKFAALSMAAVMLAGCFTGCGSKSSDSDDLAGKYEAYKMEYESETYEGDYMGIPIGTFLQFELKDNGDAIGYDEGKVDDDKITWKKDGDKLTLTPADGATNPDGSEVKPIEFKIDGDDFIYNEAGGKMYIKKVSEFSTMPANTDSED